MANAVANANGIKTNCLVDHGFKSGSPHQHRSLKLLRRLYSKQMGKQIHCEFLQRRFQIAGFLYWRAGPQQLGRE